MKVTILFAMLAMAAVPLPSFAQARVFSGQHRPRPAAPPRPGARPPRPLPAAPATPPFRSTLIWSPPPAQTRPMFPVRLPWFGLALFDPYWFGLNSVGAPSFPPAAPTAEEGRPIGGLQLDVDPRRALVYVDGRFVGVVERFSGYYRHLELPAGAHQIELVAVDYEPLLIEVVVTPGRTTTYRGSLGRVR